MKITKAFIKFTVSYFVYVNEKGIRRTREYYAEYSNSGTLKVFNPAFKVSECSKRNYFVTKVIGTLTTDNRWMIGVPDLCDAFTDVATRLQLPGFEYWQFDKAACEAGENTEIVGVEVKFEKKYYPIVRMWRYSDSLEVAIRKYMSRSTTYLEGYGGPLQHCVNIPDEVKKLDSDEFMDIDLDTKLN